MCGRFTHLYTWHELHALLALTLLPPVQPAQRYNVAPGQDMTVIVQDATGARTSKVMRWGFTPEWASAEFRPLINARSESVATKPAFAQSLELRRCIIPASGFYEWATIPLERLKVPYYFTDATRRPLLFAGLWAPNRTHVGTVVILTQAAVDLARTVHERVPVMLRPNAAATWLDHATTPDAANLLLQMNETPELRARPVARAVNSVDNDGPALIEPIGPDLDAHGPRATTPSLFGD